MGNMLGDDHRGYRIPANMIERAAVVAVWRSFQDPFRLLLAGVIGGLLAELRSRPSRLELARWDDDGGAGA